ncbi:hypothetical protein ACOMHN_038764 [Nucella lapillus]
MLKVKAARNEDEGDTTRPLDRGGLTCVKPNIAEVFKRQLAGIGSDVKEVDVDTFVSRCLECTDGDSMMLCISVDRFSPLLF